LVEKQEVVECERCLMDENVVGFEKLVVGCNFCEYFFVQKRLYDKSYNELVDVLDPIRFSRMNEKYDAILGISGGYDSSSVCYWSKKLRLRVLLVHVDNGFNTKIADGNIKAMVDWSGYDIVYPKVDVDAYTRFYLNVIRSGVANLEHVTDSLITSVLLKIAKKEGIKLFISGSNVNTEALRVRGWESPNTDRKNLYGIARYFGKECVKDLDKLELLSAWQVGKYMLKSRVLYPLNYMSYSSLMMGEFLSRVVRGYKKYGEKHEESILTDWFQWYWLVSKYGVDKRKIYYSNNVLAGHMTREEAKSKLLVEVVEKPEQMRVLADKFGFEDVFSFKEFLDGIEPVDYEEYGVGKIQNFMVKYYFGLRRRLRGY